MMTPKKRYCRVCNEEIHGRRDKQYCTDYCRATYFNSLNIEIAGLIRRVNYTIRKNRNILEKLNHCGETRVHRHTLLDSGLNFNYFTSIYRTKAGNTYFFCYDQGYLELEGEYYMLIAKEDYVGETVRSRTLGNVAGE